jgi:CubicO group peptidase (beta-lactamase class C family)
VLLLHDRGKLSTDDPVRKHVPELPEYYKEHPIRVADLLRQTSGLPEYFQFKGVRAKNGRYRVNADYLPEFARRVGGAPAKFPAGEQHRYTNSNYMLLAVVVERASGRPLGAFLREEVFDRLGMDSTFVCDSPGAVRKHPRLGRVTALGYQPRDGKERWVEAWGCPPDRTEDELVVGDGGVWSSLDDLRKWDAAVRGRKLLKPETWQQALTPSKTRDGKTNRYGMGWALVLDPAGKVTAIWHDGGWRGFRTIYYHDPASGRTTVLLGNRWDFDPQKFFFGVCEVMDRAGKGGKD